MFVWNFALLIFNQSINHLFILKEKKIINKYNKIKLNKSNKTFRNNLALIYFEERACIKPCVFRGDCLDIQDRELGNNSPLVEAVNHFHKELHTRCLSSPRSTPVIPICSWRDSQVVSYLKVFPFIVTFK